MPGSAPAVFDAAQSLEILDGIAAALLAAAASARARNFGAHFTGAVVLGCVCGVAGGLAREIFLRGSAGARLALTGLPGSAVVGAIAGVFAVMFLNAKKFRVFFWLDAASLGIASSLACVVGLPELGIVGALTLGLVAGLSPSIIRDASLGDTAMIVDKSWYAAAAALGCLAAVACVIGGLIVDEGERIGEYAVLSGACVALAARYFKGRNEE